MAAHKQRQSLRASLADVNRRIEVSQEGAMFVGVKMHSWYNRAHKKVMGKGQGQVVMKLPSHLRL